MKRESVYARSGNDVRNEVILDSGDAVSELEFALFQPRDLELIHKAAFAGFTERCNGDVEVAMLAFQRFQALSKFLLIHRRRSRISPYRMASRSGFVNSQSCGLI